MKSLQLLALFFGLTATVVVIRAQGQIVPQPTGNCLGCLCIAPGMVLTLNDGDCAVTYPGGDTIIATGGAVTVSTDNLNALNAIVIGSGAQADVTVISGSPTIPVLGGSGSLLTVNGVGLTLNVDMAAGSVSVSGSGNTIVDENLSGQPTRYLTSPTGPASHQLELNGHQGSQVVGFWFIDP